MRLLGLVVLVIVPWLALVLYTQTDERRVAVANVDRDAMRVLELVTSHQEAQIDTARQLLTALARLPQLRTPDTCNALLKEMLGAYPRYTNFVAVDPVGNVTCSAAPMRGPINVSDRAYFQRATIRSAASRSFPLSPTRIPSTVPAATSKRWWWPCRTWAGSPRLSRSSTFLPTRYSS
jgi:hypothetical protein